LFVIISNKYSLEAVAFALLLFFILLERLDECLRRDKSFTS